MNDQICDYVKSHKIILTTNNSRIELKNVLILSKSSIHNLSTNKLISVLM